MHIARDDVPIGPFHVCIQIVTLMQEAGVPHESIGMSLRPFVEDNLVWHCARGIMRRFGGRVRTGAHPFPPTAIAPQRPVSHRRSLCHPAGCVTLPRPPARGRHRRGGPTGLGSNTHGTRAPVRGSAVASAEVQRRALSDLGALGWGKGLPGSSTRPRSALPPPGKVTCRAEPPPSPPHLDSRPPGVVKQDKSSGGCVDTTKTR